MFRRLPHSLPEDCKPPRDLAKLGYFINGNDQIRMIRDPESNYKFNISRNDRVNEVYLAAMNDCIREIVKQRLLDRGLEIYRLPLGAQKSDQHVPIYGSKHIATKQRILIVFGQRNVDPGIFSFRGIRHESIDTGSAVTMVEAITNTSALARGHESIGVIFTNPSQLIWCRSESRAVGDAEWLGLPRTSAFHEPCRIDPVRNRVPDNRDYTEHVRYIFEHFIPEQVHPDATINIIGLEYTGMAALHYLAEHWSLWADRVNGVCLGNPQHTFEELKTISGNDAAFLKFIRQRTRAYLLSDAPVETPVAGIERTGCNCYASGEELFDDGIMIKGWGSMLDWFNMVNIVTDYVEPTFIMTDSKADNEGN